MGNIKLYDAVSRFIDKRPKIQYLSIPEVAQMVNLRYDWEEFGDLDTEIVAEWIGNTWGWDSIFTLEEASNICDIAANDGFRGARGINY